MSVFLIVLSCITLAFASGAVYYIKLLSQAASYPPKRVIRQKALVCFNRNRLYTMSYLFHKTPRLKHADMLRALCSKKPLPEAEEVLCDNYLAASIKLERLKMVCTIG